MKEDIPATQGIGLYPLIIFYEGKILSVGIQDRIEDKEEIEEVKGCDIENTEDISGIYYKFRKEHAGREE